MAHAGIRSRLDLAGGILAGAAVGWTFLSAASGGGDPAPVAALISASAIVVVLSVRAASVVGRWLMPSAIVVFAALIAVMDGGLLSRSPLQGPFGYANAAAAFFVQAAFAGLLLGVMSRSVAVRVLGVGACVMFAALPVLRGSVAAGVLVALGSVGALAARGTRGPRVTIVCCAALLTVAVATTGLLGATFRPGAASGPFEGTAIRIFSERRLELWHDAVEIIGMHPTTGVGPGRFEDVSPTARADRDASWAHSGFLQQGAEQGIVGFLLLCLIVTWAFLRLRSVPAPDMVTALGAVSIGALGILASIDYVLHFPAVPLAAAALLGTAIAEPRSTRVRRGAEHHDRSEADAVRFARS